MLIPIPTIFQEMVCSSADRRVTVAGKQIFLLALQPIIVKTGIDPRMDMHALRKPVESSNEVHSCILAFT